MIVRIRFPFQFRNDYHTILSLLIMAFRWLCISNRDNAEVTLMKNIWGVARRFQKIISNVRIGDTLLIYTMQEIVDKEIYPSAIVGEFEVTSAVYEDKTPIFIPPMKVTKEIFPFRIKVKVVNIYQKPVEFKPLVPELSFIKNKVMWSGSIRRAMRIIPEEDYQCIVGQINE